MKLLLVQDDVIYIPKHTNAPCVVKLLTLQRYLSLRSLLRCASVAVNDHMLTHICSLAGIREVSAARQSGKPTRTPGVVACACIRLRDTASLLLRVVVGVYCSTMCSSSLPLSFYPRLMTSYSHCMNVDAAASMS